MEAGGAQRITRDMSIEAASQLKLMGWKLEGKPNNAKKLEASLMLEQWMTTVGKVVAAGETAVTTGMKLVRQMEKEEKLPDGKKEHIAEIKKLCADRSDKIAPMNKWQLLGTVDEGTKLAENILLPTGIGDV